MFEIFNMGIGMVLAVSKENVARVKAVLAELDEPCYELGQVVAATKDAPAITINEEKK